MDCDPNLTVTGFVHYNLQHFKRELLDNLAHPPELVGIDMFGLVVSWDHFFVHWYCEIGTKSSSYDSVSFLVIYTFIICCNLTSSDVNAT